MRKKVIVLCVCFLAAFLFISIGRSEWNQSLSLNGAIHVVSPEKKAETTETPKNKQDQTSVDAKTGTKQDQTSVDAKTGAKQDQTSADAKTGTDQVTAGEPKDFPNNTGVTVDTPETATPDTDETAGSADGNDTSSNPGDSNIQAGDNPNIDLPDAPSDSGNAGNEAAQPNENISNGLDFESPGGNRTETP